MFAISFHILRIAAIKNECVFAITTDCCFSEATPVVGKIIVGVLKTRGARIGFAADLQPAIRLPRTFVFLSLLFRDFIVTATLQRRSIRATVDLPSLKTNNLPQISSGFRGSPSFSIAISPRIAIDGLPRILLFRFAFSPLFSLGLSISISRFVSQGRA